MNIFKKLEKLLNFSLNLWRKWSELEPELEPELETHKNRPTPQIVYKKATSTFF
jgi:hypothetical protein